MINLSRNGFKTFNISFNCLPNFLDVIFLWLANIVGTLRLIGIPVVLPILIYTVYTYFLQDSQFVVIQEIKLNEKLLGFLILSLVFAIVSISFLIICSLK